MKKKHDTPETKQIPLTPTEKKFETRDGRWRESMPRREKESISFVGSFAMVNLRILV
jgi:hypothetical protein